MSKLLTLLLLLCCGSLLADSAQNAATTTPSNSVVPASPAPAVTPPAVTRTPEEIALSAIPFKTPVYSYVARQATLAEALAAFSAAQELSIVASPEVRLDWRISGEFKDIPSTQFLTRLCAMGNLIWYYDQAALYLYNSGQVQTELMELMYIHADDVRRMLKDLGVEDPRYPIATTHQDELLLIAGPPRYVQLIKELVGKADKLQAQRTSREDTVMIFPLRHAWADDVTLGAGSESQEVKGVATLLKELMNMREGGNVDTASKPKAKESVVPQPPENVGYAKLAPRTVPGDDAKKEEDNGSGSGRHTEASIMADNRTNSVIVRDSKNMQPVYEQLIQRLDVPVRLVEIAVTVLDIDQSAMLDWELRIKSLYKGRRFEYGVGSDADNAFSPANLIGLGLSGSSIFSTSNLSLLTSLTALQEKNKARTISRPSLLTLDNISATLTDTRSYRTKVVGKEVVELAEVKAGMSLTVQPRIVDLPPPAQPPAEGEPEPPKYEIWMILEIQDGGFESVVVDDLPMTRTSTLNTQAGVREGESLLVGGYMHEIKTEAAWGIPWLRDIPWIGWLFGGVATENSLAQRMFLLTPRVITLDASDLPSKQAINLRATDVERKIQGALHETENEVKYQDEEQDRQNKESDKRWKEYEKRERKKRKSRRSAI